MLSVVTQFMTNPLLCRWKRLWKWVSGAEWEEEECNHANMSNQSEHHRCEEVVSSQREQDINTSPRLRRTTLMMKKKTETDSDQSMSVLNKMTDARPTERRIKKDTHNDTPDPHMPGYRTDYSVTRKVIFPSADSSQSMAIHQKVPDHEINGTKHSKITHAAKQLSQEEKPSSTHAEGFTKSQEQIKNSRASLDNSCLPTCKHTTDLPTCKHTTDAAEKNGAACLAKESKGWSISKKREYFDSNPNLPELNGKSVLGTNSSTTSYRPKTTQFISQNNQTNQMHKYGTDVSRNYVKEGKSPLQRERNVRKTCKSQKSSKKPVINTYPTKGYNCNSRKPSYTSIRRKKYKRTQLGQENLSSIQQFYDERVKVDMTSKYEAQEYIDNILETILTSKRNRGLFSRWADEEGSVAVGVKVGKADESDHSVDIKVDRRHIKLSDEPFGFEFEDDIDSSYIEELSTTFVDAGKRFFPDDVRNRRRAKDPYDVPNGFAAVRLGPADASKFLHCCTERDGRRENSTWLIPYFLLLTFHNFVGIVLRDLALEGVSLNKGAKGPAVTLTVLQEGGPNISVDITLKLTLPIETLSVSDFGWPRYSTNKWLTQDKIDIVTNTRLYLVPKGDKYFKISFANCEKELLTDIDANGTWRKGCLRIVKKKLMQWQSNSQSGLKGLSSYLLKTTLLWLCEILPDDEYWYREELANRYLNFLQELNNRLRIGRIGEYFNPFVNLLENKNQDCINELQEFVQEEIDWFESI